MMHRTRPIALAVAFVASGLLAGEASAAPGPIGEVYVESSKTVRAGEQASIKVHCPNNRPVLSGGVLVGGTHIGLTVASNGLVDGRDDDQRPDDAWKGSINNGSPDKETMTVRAQCGARSDRKYIIHITNRGRSDVGAAGGNRVDCPADMFVTGGGLVVASQTKNAPIQHAMPFGLDADGIRDDAWVTSLINNSGKPLRWVASAICADKDALGSVGGTFVTPSTTQTITGFDQEAAVIDCPANHVALGGGIGDYTDVPNTYSVASIIQRFTAEVSTGWTGWMNNLTADTETFKVAAVCFDPYA